MNCEHEWESKNQPNHFGYHCRTCGFEPGKPRCAKREGKNALDQVDREINGAFLQMKIGAIIMIASTIGLVATIVYALARQVFK